MPGTWGFKGLNTEALEFPAGANVEVAPPGRARIRFNENSGALQMSLTGGAYVDIGGGGGASPWVEAGAVVRLVTLTDQVVIGAALPVGAEDLRVVGDALLEGTVFVGSVVTTPPASGNDLELESDTGNVHVTVGTASATAFQLTDGVPVLTYDSSGPTRVLTLGDAVTPLDQVAVEADRATFDVGVDNAAFEVGVGADTYVQLDSTLGAETLAFGNTTSNPTVGMTSGLAAVTVAAAIGTTVTMPDDEARGLAVVEGANDYVVVATTNAGPSITFGNTTTNPTMTFAGSGEKIFANSGPLVMNERVGDPALTANAGKLYTKDVAAVTELFYLDSSGAVVQLTSGGVVVATDIPIADNSATAFRVHEAANNYILLSTVNAAERITLGNTGATRPAITLQLPDNVATAFQLREAATDYLAIVTTDTAETITLGNTLAATTIAVKDNTANAFRLLEGANVYVAVTTTDTAETLTLGNALTAIAEVMRDNAASGFSLAEGANSYILAATTNGTERVTIGNTGAVRPAMTIQIPDNHATPFQLREAATDYLAIVTTDTAETMTLGNTTTNPTMTFAGSGEKIFANSGPLVMNERVGDPALTANAGKLYTKDVAAVTELFYLDSSGAVVQLTSGGVVVATDIPIADNSATAFRVHEAANNYILLSTVNAAERITLGNTGATRPAITLQLPDNVATAFQLREAATDYLAIVTTDTAETITLGNTLAATTIAVKDNTANAFRLLEGANVYVAVTTTDTAETITLGNALTAISEVMRDNTASGYSLAEGANSYMLAATTNGSERVTLGNTGATRPAMTIQIPDNHATPFQLREAATDYLAIVTTDTAETMTLGNTLAAVTINVKDASATAMRVLEGANAYITVSTANAAERITFGNSGATTANYTFQIPDNVTTAFQIIEGANSYLTVLSTNNNERVRIDSNAYLGLVARGSAAAAATNEGALYTFIVGGNTDLHYREPNTGSIMQLTAGGENYVSNAIQIPERGADPATVANAGKLYTKDVSTLTELFYVNSAGTVIQITSGSSLARDFLLPDNTGTAFRLREASNNYMVVATTNSAETITFGNTTTRQDVNFDVARVHVNGPNNGSSVFQVTDAGSAVYFQVDTTTAARLITYGRNNGGTVGHLLWMKNSTSAISWSIGGADEILNVNGTAGSEAFLWGNTTANCPTHTFDLRDNKASAFLIQQGTNAYITCTTTDAAEVITYGNATATAPQHVVNLRDNLSEALIVQEGANKYIVCTTTNTTEQVIIAGSPAGADVLLGNSTSNIGFYGSTGTTQIAIGANLTNSVTAGGVDSTIANFTDLTVYANDAATIRNDIYQLARSVKFLQDFFRAAGLST